MHIPDEARHGLQERLAQWRLPAEFVTDLIDHSTPISYPKGGRIFLKGSTADVAFWVISGLVKVYHPNPDGSRAVARLAGPGDFVGMADMLEANGRRVQAFEGEAATKANVALFTREHVIKTLRRMDAECLVSLIDTLNSTWAAASAAFVKFFGLGFRERLESVIADLAARFGVKESRGILLTVELSHEELAELIASSRAMASRLVADLIEERIIARQGKRYILLNRSNDEVHAPATPADLESKGGKRALAGRLRLSAATSSGRPTR
jgi:CRP-like cAMP-binding protein